jgi:ribonuclease HI
MFYAVKNGHKKGLLTNKTALEKSIKDFANPEYKEFNNMPDAMNYLSGKNIIQKNVLLIDDTLNNNKIKNNKKIKEEFNLKDKFYAVRVGRQPGIYKTWKECQEQIMHFPNQQFKKFETKKEAEDFIKNDTISTDYDNNYDDTVLNVYTDGASFHNGKSDCRASYGVYFGEKDSRNESGLIIEKASNNRGELMGLLRAVELIKDDEEAVIHTDSMYGLKCAYDYGIKMKKAGYPKDIPNIDIIQKMREILETKSNIKFHHLNSHTNNTDKHSIGNDIVDRMATEVLTQIRNENKIKMV